MFGHARQLLRPGCPCAMHRTVWTTPGHAAGAASGSSFVCFPDGHFFSLRCFSGNHWGYDVAMFSVLGWSAQKRVIVGRLHIFQRCGNMNRTYAAYTSKGRHFPNKNHIDRHRPLESPIHPQLMAGPMRALRRASMPSSRLFCVEISKVLETAHLSQSFFFWSEKSGEIQNDLGIWGFGTP